MPTSAKEAIAKTDTSYGWDRPPGKELTSDEAKRQGYILSDKDLPAGLLDEAKATINGPRQNDYGKAEDSFEAIAQYWTVYLRETLGIRSGDIRIGRHDVANMMILMKVSRATNGFHRDSYVDIAGYAALTELL